MQTLNDLVLSVPIFLFWWVLIVVPITRNYAFDVLESWTYEIKNLPISMYIALKALQSWIALYSDESKEICGNCGWIKGKTSHGDYTCYFNWIEYVRMFDNDWIRREQGKIPREYYYYMEEGIYHIQSKLRFSEWADVVIREFARRNLIRHY